MMKKFLLKWKKEILPTISHNFPLIAIKIIFIKTNVNIFPYKYATFIKSE